MTALDLVRDRRCRVVTRPLGSGPPPEVVIAALAGAPQLTALIGEWAGGSAVVTSHPLVVLDPNDDPFAALRTHPHIEGDGAEHSDVIGGGWFGWLGYDSAASLAFHDHVFRHRDGEWWFEALWSDERASVLLERIARMRAVLSDPVAPAPARVGTFTGAPRATHLEAVERAIEWIRAGEIYQVNVCTRLAADFHGAPGVAFARAAQLVAPRFGGLVDRGGRAVVCLSPELFLRRRGRDVMTSPIKGTAPRDGDQGAERLAVSVKDAAENVMIVDLMRNDLGRVCEAGSVRTGPLLDLEPHPGVWHLVSTVRGRLRSDVDDGALLAATFPPGSVTGAPKLRSMEAIGELESQPRGAYTGAVGFASARWGAEFAVAIRTFEIADARIELGVGGGVTVESVPMREWHECLDKAAPLVTAIGGELGVDRDEECATPDQLAGGLLETILVQDGVAVALADHLARLDRSARELYAVGVPADLPARAVAEASATAAGRAVLRLVLNPNGDVSITVGAASTAPPRQLLRVAVADGGLWRHKWADRSLIGSRGVQSCEPHEDVLFVAADGTVLETRIGNVFLINAAGELCTPPLRDDLLPGITRRLVLDAARDAGRPTCLRPFTVDELQTCAAFWTSSISGLVPIEAVDGVALPRNDDDIAELAAALRIRVAANSSGGRSVR